ncbi:response regulator transcription factor [Azospirillum doebereinerae]|uniref:Response regulator transcription factor n=1 Tax=Azospirillum doebereinerae TaxID=92933 RepID=A0A3S0V437_9PROT|nr:response regulator transcription factor [Azospirillum doebereinerae]MCG5243641.1 response regulator transcription factor [Azospirillum doebereinerae]RUQ66509.1 response regulator transcription factor [Azospirillum doebereinerae]
MPVDVLVVEDHADLREEIVSFLQRRRMTVRTAASASEMDKALADRLPDIVILDLGLPGEDGISIAGRLTSGGPRPGLIIVTARGRVEDRILGLHSGADIYLVKPVDLRELEAAVLSVMRRRSEPPAPLAAWRLDITQWRLITPGGVAVLLNEMEVRFLSPFFETPGATIDRSLVAERVQGDARGIDLLVHRLRRKVEADTGEALPVRTVHARGFAFTAPAML